MAAASSSSSSSRSHWPPGFRFRPTDQELVGFYLSRKVAGRPIQAGVIGEVDLYKCEPWDLPDKSPFQNDVEWYFFCARDKKYPNGSRTNRATEAGYWKATGKDRVVRSGSKGIGMKKTLVFYKGRAPHGERTEWIMHEYRLEAAGKQQQQQQFQDAYVLCRVFKKGAVLKSEEEVLPSYLDDEFACPSPSFPPAAAEPEEGQVCSPSPAEIAHNTVAPSGPEENADDSLNAFLMMLLEEPSPEESQMLPLESGGLVEPTGYGSLLDEPDTLEQLLQQAEEGSSVLQNVDNRQFAGDEMSVMDMLAGDFIELNDLLPSSVQQSYEQHDSPIDLSKYLESEVVPSASKVVAYDGLGDEGMLIMSPAQAAEGETTTTVVLEGGQKHPVKRFLGMLGSIHVLPASAAEYPGGSSRKVKTQPVDCSAIHMNVAVTFACSCLSKKKKKSTTEGLDRAVATSSTKRRSNLFFVFLVGSVSALFWILLLPALSRLSSYVHAALL